MGIGKSKEESVEQQIMEKLLPQKPNRSQNTLEHIKSFGVEENGSPPSCVYLSNGNYVEQRANIDSFAERNLEQDNELIDLDKSAMGFRIVQEPDHFNQLDRFDKDQSSFSKIKQTTKLPEIDGECVDYYEMSGITQIACDFNNIPQYISSHSDSTEQTDVSFVSNNDTVDIPSDLEDITPFVSDAGNDRHIDNFCTQFEINFGDCDPCNQTFQTTTEVLENLGIDSQVIDELAEWLDKILTNPPSNPSVDNEKPKDDPNAAVSDGGSSSNSDYSSPSTPKATVDPPMSSKPATVQSSSLNDLPTMNGDRTAMNTI